MRYFPATSRPISGAEKQSKNQTVKEPFWRYDDLKVALHYLHEIDFPLQVFIIVDEMDELDNVGRNEVLLFYLDFLLEQAAASANYWSLAGRSLIPIYM